MTFKESCHRLHIELLEERLNDAKARLYRYLETQEKTNANCLKTSYSQSIANIDKNR
jgi:hypothetical protein